MGLRRGRGVRPGAWVGCFVFGLEVEDYFGFMRDLGIKSRIHAEEARGMKYLD